MSARSLPSLLEAIRQLKQQALAQEAELAEQLAELHPSHRIGGRNFAHYLAVRQNDIRELQRDLASLGLSSLGRMEKVVLPTLSAVERLLVLLSQRGSAPPELPNSREFEQAAAELSRNASALLGPEPARRAARIMVTLPLDASPELIDELVGSGAEVLRINCAKGEHAQWLTLVESIRDVEARHKAAVRILCDLAGPNPRTAALDRELAPGTELARVEMGERLRLVRKPSARGTLPELGVTLPAVLDDLRPGERVFYDDGKLAGRVVETNDEGATIEVTFARKGRVKLRAEKGLNFPDTRLRLPSLTDKDLHDLSFIAEHADMVGLSFVRAARDVELLQRELRRLRAHELGVVLKVETTQAFEALPHLLLQGMQSSALGVMVARGDMAIEMGFERLAEAQEEVLWLCEAALIPVIWATQVLENLNKTGLPSRAEVTDAAMSGRAECVMLNQGEHIDKALRFLRDVLERMQAHQEKKRSMLRQLQISML
jgi:pyruvate kinase